ncbi:glycosyltransferase family 4 protein [Lactobacillus sp. 3B(2020)]|uniref:glycosyltransferase family 4 protein n=1 Tax=Lactobacillus sp. 3B(2020) TaxID=2695882 RepID=UPI0015DD566B|nr:glycosyltransferase family 4 protein [Lactobacillus sp. 3B(2020)]QLL70965.1 glycosyltransferase [Lactobacillus sp. 3B(2020)]
MIKITMFSQADSVKGQGVGSAYNELVTLLRERFSSTFDLAINSWRTTDISHYHTINPTYFLSTFSKKRGRKIGYVHFLPETLEGSLKIPQPWRSLFYRYVIAFYKRMDHLVVVNPNFIPKLVAYGIKQEKITYIPNFVDSSHFFPVDTKKKEQLRIKYQIPQDQFVVFGSGQLQERKGIFDFIQLAKQNPQTLFIWAGGFSFGAITDGYKQLKAVVKNPPTNLRFPGIVSREVIAEYNNLADLFLLPSYNELFPMSVLEAFSCGTPVMLRDLSLYHGIIGGYYEPATDLKMMQTKLRTLSKDPQALAELRDKSCQAAKRYSKDHLAQVWKHFYFSQVKEH